MACQRSGDIEAEDQKFEKYLTTATHIQSSPDLVHELSTPIVMNNEPQRRSISPIRSARSRATVERGTFPDRLQIHVIRDFSPAIYDVNVM